MSEKIFEENKIKANISFNISDIYQNESSSIPKLLEDRDILLNMEEGNYNLHNILINPKKEDDNVFNLKINSEKYDYESEDENLLHLSENNKIHDLTPFKNWSLKMLNIELIKFIQI